MYINPIDQMHTASWEASLMLLQAIQVSVFKWLVLLSLIVSIVVAVTVFFNSAKLYFGLQRTVILNGKLAEKQNSKTAPLGMGISAGDLLTTRKLKNTDATSHLHCQRSARLHHQPITEVTITRVLIWSSWSDGGFCPWINYRGLNDITVKFRYLLMAKWSVLNQRSFQPNCIRKKVHYWKLFKTIHAVAILLS